MDWLSLIIGFLLGGLVVYFIFWRTYWPQIAMETVPLDKWEIMYNNFRLAQMAVLKLREMLTECVDSLEYVDKTHKNISGIELRQQRIEDAKRLLEVKV